MSCSVGDKGKIARSILSYVYYWYNFMPLARGTAACGHTTILSLFWAAGMPITASIPDNYQIDWEAILEPHPDVFTHALYKWLVPDDARPEALKGETLPVRLHSSSRPSLHGDVTSGFQGMWNAFSKPRLIASCWLVVGYNAQETRSAERCGIRQNLKISFLKDY